MKINRRILVLFFIGLLTKSAIAQKNENEFELYGSVITDGGYNFQTIDPNWFDVMRPTKLPSYKNQYGAGGNVFFSVRQTKFGINSISDTKLGLLKIKFDFDLFGFGKDAGQTTFHLVNAYAQLGKFGFGQTPSVFMDVSVFPETLDYWGPSSRVFFLNIQFRYTAIDKENQRLAFALERPGGTSDGVDYTGTVDLKGITPVFKLPNLTVHYRRGGEWGHMQVGGLVKYLKWVDQPDSALQNLSGNTIAWGVNLSTIIHASKNIDFKLQGEFGNGIENYIADAGVDIGLQSNADNLTKPIVGKALPIFGFFAFTEISWSSQLRSSIGYSLVSIKNADLQSPSAFKLGQYGLANLRYYPVDKVMVGIEYQYGKRNNHSDGFYSTDNKLQLQCQVNFSKIFKQDKQTQ